LESFVSNLKKYPYEKFIRTISNLNPRKLLGKISIKCRNYSMGKIPSKFCVSFKLNFHGKFWSELFLSNIGVLTYGLMDYSPTNQHRKFSNLFLENFEGIFQADFSDILFHWRKIIRGINLGNIPRIFLIPRSFS
jgi:hypothetical protein